MRLIILLVVARACSAQLCMPEMQPQPNSPYVYIRAEIKAFHWIRNALAESKHFQPLPPANGPQRFHKTVELYSAVQNVSDDYDCAASILTKYKESTNVSIRESVDALLLAINTTKDINTKLVGLMESLNKAEKPEDIDQVAIAKMLANIKSIQKDVLNLAIAGAKMSTFSIVRMEGDADNAKPVAFTITSKERATLLAEAQGLAKKKGEYTYVDGCAAILLDTLTRQLRTPAQ